MGKESAERIQTSLLSKAEKKALVWLAQRQPGWMTSDTLTYIGVLGTVIYAIGGWLSNTDIKYLWLSSFGLVLHWYGDSLDGTLARFRNTQRPDTVSSSTIHWMPSPPASSFLVPDFLQCSAWMWHWLPWQAI